MERTGMCEAIGLSHRQQRLRHAIESFVEAPAGPRPWWTPSRLILVLVVMAWGEGGAGWVDRFAAARSMWDQTWTAMTYQGFAKALLRHGLGLIAGVAGSLRRRLLDPAGDQLRRFGFFVLGVDGSRFELPRTAPHERVGLRHSGPGRQRPSVVGDDPVADGGGAALGLAGGPGAQQRTRPPAADARLSAIGSRRWCCG